MPYRRDKISDVVRILSCIKKEFDKRTKYCSPTSLRKQVIEELAESEVRSKRFKNQHSGEETLRDACTRRLEPDIIGIEQFDRHVGQWLRDHSVALKDILLRQSNDLSQKTEVNRFFDKIS